MKDGTPPAWAGLLRLLTGKWATHALFAAVELGLAEALRDGALTAGQVASKLGSSPDPTHRLLRALAGIGVFDRTGEDMFAINSISERLCADHPESMANLVRMFGAPWHHRIWCALAEAVRSGRSGAEHAFETTLWSHFETNPADLGTFNAAMFEVSNTIGAAAIDACDFPGVDVLVDVGGGRGQLLGRVLQRYPHLSGIVFDRPALEAEALALLERLKLRDRCKFIGGDFLESVPAGGDAYLMSHVLHDWPDADALTILRSCRAAMRPGTRLRVLEGVLRPPGERDWGGLLDLEMISMFGGRERTAEEFARLFREAGFALEQVVRTPSPTSIVEGVAV